MAISFKILLLVLAFVACTASLKFAHKGSYAWYTYDESNNDGGCSEDDHCDGQRTCSEDGECQGEARPEKNADYKYNESYTLGRCPRSSTDRNYENRGYYCSGNRKCVSGTCRRWF